MASHLPLYDEPTTRDLRVRYQARYVEETIGSLLPPVLSVICACGHPIGRVLGNGRIAKLKPCWPCRLHLRSPRP